MTLAVSEIWVWHAPAGVVVWLCEKYLGPVGVDPGQHVDDPVVHDLGDHLVLAILRDQVPDGLEADVGAGGLAAVGVAVNPDAGLLLAGPRLEVSNLHGPEVPALHGLADAVKFRETGVLLVEPLHYPH